MKLALLTAILLLGKGATEDNADKEKTVYVPLRQEIDLDELNIYLKNRYGPKHPHLNNIINHEWDDMLGLPYKYLDSAAELPENTSKGMTPTLRATASRIFMYKLDTLWQTWADQTLIKGTECPSSKLSDGIPSKITFLTILKYRKLQREFIFLFMAWYKGLSVGVKSGLTGDSDPSEIGNYIKKTRLTKTSHLDAFMTKFYEFMHFWDGEIAKNRCSLIDYLNFEMVLNQFTYLHNHFPPNRQNLKKYSLVVSRMKKYQKIMAFLDKSVQTFMFMVCVFRETVDLAHTLKSSVEIEENTELLLISARVCIKMIDKLSYNSNKIESLIARSNRYRKPVVQAMVLLSKQAGVFLPIKSLAELEAEVSKTVGLLRALVLLGLLIIYWQK